MNDRRKNEKSKFIPYCLGCCAILLVGCLCFVFLYFQTDIIMDVDTAVSHKVVDFERTKVSTYLTSRTDKDGGTPGLGDGETTPGITPPGPGGDPVELTGIYTNTTLSNGTLKGTISNIPYYNGWPIEWGSGDVTICDWYGMFEPWKKDFAALGGYSASDLNTASITTAIGWGNALNTLQNINGVNCLPLSCYPVWVLPNYYEDSFNGKNPSWSESDATSKYICAIFTDGSQTYYVPLCSGDNKGHTGIGGVCQTWIRQNSYTGNTLVGDFANAFSIDGNVYDRNYNQTVTLNGRNVFEYKGENSAGTSSDGDNFSCSVSDAVKLFVTGSNWQLLYDGYPCKPHLSWEVHSDLLNDLKGLVSNYDLVGIAFKDK